MDDRAPFVSVRIPLRLIGIVILLVILFFLLAFSSWSINDPSLSYATDTPVQNWMGFPGAVVADLWIQFFGLASLVVLLPLSVWGWALVGRRTPTGWPLRLGAWFASALLAAGLLSCIPPPSSWPLPTGLGGLVGTGFTTLAESALGRAPSGAAAIFYALVLLPPTLAVLWVAAGLKSISSPGEEAAAGSAENDVSGEGFGSADRVGLFDVVFGAVVHFGLTAKTAWRRAGESAKQRREEKADEAWQRQAAEPVFAQPAPGSAAPGLEREFERREPTLGPVGQQEVLAKPDIECHDFHDHSYDQGAQSTGSDHEARLTIERATSARSCAPSGNAATRSAASAPDFVAPKHIATPPARVKPGTRTQREAQGSLLVETGFRLPELSLLSPPPTTGINNEHRPEELEIRARQLEGVLEDFGVKGDIINVRPGPVVTLYELEPAPGIKSSRVISLADDIARSMSAVSARVAVVPGRNAIGIELPNSSRETVYLREMLASKDFEEVRGKLPICLGKTIGGEPIIADLARMPHLLIAGTTGSGKSVGINTMILSLLYRMTPEQCRLIMIDPKMLELSIYDGIPHLLSPVVTDPTKAVVALKWAVREMEDRYRKMSKIGVRNIDGFNSRVAEANKKGETITRTVQTGFDRETGEAIYESESFDLEPLPFIVIVVDEMADLMMVAGKDIEGAIQRLAQMARAAGIHLIMATQRPSVDVITGTIKANFPTRVSFQVTSKIDSRTILGEQGAEQLLGMGDMLYMAGGGRLRRLHGPFVKDSEVEDVVNHLKEQGAPDYLESVTEEPQDTEGSTELGNSGDELYDKAVNIALSDRKASTSYIQRRLSIGYNRAATLIERMEQEGVISPANHAGKREVLVGDGID
ncbi:MAG TPA: DNA translocase FtsK [Devosia sp.]|nr:DNA translocase FtsK [Devosia sp.]